MLEWTGERFLPHVDMKVTGSLKTYEHPHRYAFISSFMKGKTVLDLASGEGYGCDLLSRRATNTVGIDIDPNAIIHAQEH